jgi:hypothetical protein
MHLRPGSGLMLQGAREGILTDLRPYNLHGEVYYEVRYTLADDPGGPAHGARLPHDALYPNPQAGDRVRVHFVMNMLVKVEPANRAAGAARPGI